MLLHLLQTESSESLATIRSAWEAPPTYRDREFGEAIHVETESRVMWRGGRPGFFVQLGALITREFQTTLWTERVHQSLLLFHLLQGRDCINRVSWCRLRTKYWGPLWRSCQHRDWTVCALASPKALNSKMMVLSMPTLVPKAFLRLLTLEALLCPSTGCSGLRSRRSSRSRWSDQPFCVNMAPPRKLDAQLSSFGTFAPQSIHHSEI
jgi:hypothetical protein